VGLRAGITKVAKKWDKRRFPKMQEQNAMKRESRSEGAKWRKHLLEVGNNGNRQGMISEGFLKESIKRKGDA
jgi:hypothetical protein